MFPQTGSRRYTHTHLKWFMGTLVFSKLHCRDFSFLYFLLFFLRTHKKHKNANKWISYFFQLRCFLSTLFYFCLLICVFVFLLGCVFMHFGTFCAFCAFGAFWCVQNLFVKKNKEFKTALISSFILLLTPRTSNDGFASDPL